MQMKVFPGFLQRSVQAESGVETLQNIQVQIQAEEGEQNTETGEPNQDPENLSAEVQRHQPAGEGRQRQTSQLHHLGFSFYLLYCLYACTLEII